MTCYIVTFEANSEQSRQRIVERLKTFSTYCPITKYCWAILTDKNSVGIRDYIREIMDAGERIFVIRSGTEAAWLNAFGKKNSEWLKRNL